MAAGKLPFTQQQFLSRICGTITSSGTWREAALIQRLTFGRWGCLIKTCKFCSRSSVLHCRAYINALQRPSIPARKCTKSGNPLSVACSLVYLRDANSKSDVVYVLYRSLPVTDLDMIAYFVLFLLLSLWEVWHGGSRCTLTLSGKERWYVCYSSRTKHV